MIEAVGISKIYQSTVALQDVSLSIAKGDIYGIIGSSGAGKSTLIRCFCRLIVPTAGKIFFHGVDICQLKGQNLRNFHVKTGMIFQHFNLLGSRTVRENVAYPLEIVNMAAMDRNARVEELLRLVGLSPKINMYPSQLSGGEKQRVGIARALANHPEILFCDEATSALDPRTTKEILDLLKSLNKKLGLTIVLITHDMEVIKRACNKVAVLEGGKIVEEGLVTDIFADPRHPTTQKLIQSTSHDIPLELIPAPSPNRKLLRLRFKGKAAAEPIISLIVKKFQVEANILMGWIDHVQTIAIGTIVIELTGMPAGIEETLRFLSERSIIWESIERV